MPLQMIFMEPQLMLDFEATYEVALSTTRLMPLQMISMEPQLTLNFEATYEVGITLALKFDVVVTPLHLNYLTIFAVLGHLLLNIVLKQRFYFEL